MIDSWELKPSLLQFAFDVTDDEEEFMVQLMQKDTRGDGGSDNKTIGYSIFRVSVSVCVCVRACVYVCVCVCACVRACVRA